MSDKLIVALDVEELKVARRLVDELSGVVKIFKIGSQLFTACGRSAVDMVRERGSEVFMDLKFHDIPSTVAKASRIVAKCEVFMFNLHSLGGKQMMKEAVESATKSAEEFGTRKPIILGVTVLTSMERGDLNSVGVMRSVRGEVLHLARMCKESGLDGVVSSPREIMHVRKAMGEDFLIITPGIRPSGAERNDQKRVMSPGEAISAGADYIVVGRPITEAEDPRRAAEEIIEELRSANCIAHSA